MGCVLCCVVPCGGVCDVRCGSSLSLGIYPMVWWGGGGRRGEGGWRGGEVDHSLWVVCCVVLCPVVGCVMSGVGHPSH